MAKREKKYKETAKDRLTNLFRSVVERFKCPLSAEQIIATHFDPELIEACKQWHTRIINSQHTFTDFHIGHDTDVKISRIAWGETFKMLAPHPQEFRLSYDDKLVQWCRDIRAKVAPWKYVYGALRQLDQDWEGDYTPSEIVGLWPAAACLFNVKQSKVPSAVPEKVTAMTPLLRETHAPLAGAVMTERMSRPVHGRRLMTVIFSAVKSTYENGDWYFQCEVPDFEVGVYE